MCDLIEAIYSPNDVVWVKLGPVWWPGRVCGEDEIPPEIMKDLKKKPIAIVKFFQEDSFEYVKSLSNIYHYHCARKNEFIKKGLDLLRSKNTGIPSNMKLFPEDIVRAECLTNGNPAILQSDIFLPEEKPVYTDLFTSNKKAPKKVKSDAKKKQIPAKQSTPRLITHPRFLQLSSGQSTDYEARERKQIPVRAECDVEDSSPLTLYSCTECDYTTTRLNVMVWHNKSHTRNYASPQASGKATKRSSTASAKLKERLSGSSPSVEPKANDTEGPSAAKIPKTNGTLTVTRSPKTPGRPGRKKGSTAANKASPKETPHTKKPKSTSTNRPVEKSRRGSGHKTDEIHKSLLEDWLEDDIEQEEPATDENSLAEYAEGENKALANSSMTSNDSNCKSCFDFDDSEDQIVIDESKFKPGRKIPRLLKKSSPLTAAAEDVVAISDSVDATKVEAVSTDSTPQYQSGVEDSLEGESSLRRSQTSRLQEVGVENEIEIKTEEVHVDEVVIESEPPKKSRRKMRTETKANDSAELHDQVDKLLNEISKTPAKLPEIPRSHKKAQLKAYQQQAEAEARKVAAEAEAAEKAIAEGEAKKQAAAEAKAVKKAAAEAETAQKAAAEAKAAQKAAAEAEAAIKAAAEAEAAQKAAAETEAAQQAAAEAEAAQKAAAEAEAAQKAVAEAEAAQKAAAEAEAAQIASAEAEAVRILAAEAAATLNAAQQKTNSDKDATEKMLTGQPNLGEKEANNLHLETMDIEVSSIPLPSPKKCPVTSDPFESSISIGASVTVTENQAPDEQSSTISSKKVSSGMLDVKNVVPGLAINQKTTAATVEEGGPPTAADDKSTPASKTTKILNATSLLCSGQKSVLLTPSQYQELVSKMNASPGKTSVQLMNPTKATIKLCNLSQPNVLQANSPSSSTPKKFIILAPGSKKSSILSTTTTPASASAASPTLLAGRSINLSNATTLRVAPTMLQTSVAAQKAAAVLAQSRDKNVTMDASIFQTLLSQLAVPKVAVTTEPQARSNTAAATGPSQSGIVFVADSGTSMASMNDSCANTVVSNSSAGETINFLVDSSGALVQEDEPSTGHTSGKESDILAEALQNTDGMQTEMTLSQATSNSVLDACSATQNPNMAYKSDVIYENLTLSTAPIMSSYETPSRAVAPTNIVEGVANEVAIVGDGTVECDSEYLN